MRVLRAFRLFRLFGKMGQLKRIVTAVVLSIVPTLQALVREILVGCFRPWWDGEAYRGDRGRLTLWCTMRPKSVSTRKAELCYSIDPPSLEQA